ncbi:MAG: hypothetical protein AB2421_17195 [Thermotaleaceae bacterium]
MLRQMHEDLVEIKKKLLERERLKRLVDKGQKELSELKDKRESLSIALEKEKRDVDKIEGLSLTNLFHCILGDKEACLEKERQEFLALKMKYDEVNHAIANLNAYIFELDSRIQEMSHLDLTYQRVMNRKLEILKTDPDFAAALIAISEEKSHLQSLTTELRETESIGIEILRSLQEVDEALQAARGWGTWDILGGGLITTMAKHSRINDARAQMNGVQSMLYQFRRELADLENFMDFHIEVGEFTTFADCFFDGLIADFIVQQKIGESLQTVQEMSQQIEKILHHLQKSLVETKKKEQILEKEKNKMIEKALL